MRATLLLKRSQTVALSSAESTFRDWARCNAIPTSPCPGSINPRSFLLMEDIPPFVNLFNVLPMIMVGHAHYPTLSEARPDTCFVVTPRCRQIAAEKARISRPDHHRRHDPRGDYKPWTHAGTIFWKRSRPGTTCCSSLRLLRLWSRPFRRSCDLPGRVRLCAIELRHRSKEFLPLRGAYHCPFEIVQTPEREFSATSIDSRATLPCRRKGIGLVSIQGLSITLAGKAMSTDL